jgi:RHS repeat-associated protein
MEFAHPINILRWQLSFRRLKAYTVNGLNQYTAVAGTAQTYDANGNLTGDGTNAYIYDGENRLVSATAAGVTATLTYDTLGRLWRVQKGAADTRFLTDGDAIVAEYDGSGIMTNHYVHGSNAAADDPLVWYVGANFATARHLHADHLGSIVGITNCNASAPCILAYDEYGVPGAANVGRFQYTGQAWLSELGLYYYKSRLYDPHSGRFLQTDPVGYAGGINIYAYVGDDPVNAGDATGLGGECDTGSRLADNSGGCKVAEGYKIDKSTNSMGRTVALLAPGSSTAARQAATATVQTGLLARLASALRYGVYGLFTLLSGDARHDDRQIFTRYMSAAELSATRRSGLIRGGREGPAFFTSETVLRSASAAADRYSLPQNPQLVVGFRFVGETPPYATGIVRPDDLGHHGGGVEHMTEQPAPVEITGVLRLDQ